MSKSKKLLGFIEENTNEKAKASILAKKLFGESGSVKEAFLAADEKGVVTNSRDAGEWGKEDAQGLAKKNRGKLVRGNSPNMFSVAIFDRF